MMMITGDIIDSKMDFVSNLGMKMLNYDKYFSWILHCADCGTVFENKYDSECKVCGSTRKSYKTPQPADWKPYEEPKKRKKKSGIKISKRTLAILTLFMIALTVGIVTTIDDISNPPDDYASNSSNDFNKNTFEEEKY